MNDQEIPGNTPLSLDLNATEVQSILDALSFQPIRTTLPLLQKIEQQAIAQLNPPQPPLPEDPTMKATSKKRSK
jgi:hypothetical protein